MREPLSRENVAALGPVGRRFYQRDTLEVARELLGLIVVRTLRDDLVALRIAEVEAYLGVTDRACHTFGGRRTPRTEVMWGEAGHLYVYFTYGMHYCVNIVVGQKGVGEAVLLRAAEPLEGIEVMFNNRYGPVQGPTLYNLYNQHITDTNVRGLTSHISGITDIKNLANGPAKLTQALGITDTSLSGKMLNGSSIWLEAAKEPLKASDIVASPRIGIKEATQMPWRFYIKDNQFVSKYNKNHDG